MGGGAVWDVVEIYPSMETREDSHVRAIHQDWRRALTTPVRKYSIEDRRKGEDLNSAVAALLDERSREAPSLGSAIIEIIALCKLS
jgi:hypothetical protein